MNIHQFFHRKKKQQQRQEPQPLRIEGIAPAPFTAEPDEAELAAQALLEMMSAADDKSRNNDIPSSCDNGKDAPHDAVYYRQLADRIRQAHESARLRTMRFVAFVEHELKSPHLPLTGPGSLGLIEAELYKRIDIVERYGGDLKRRWQYCLAQVTVRIWRRQRPSEQDSKLEN